MALIRRTKQPAESRLFDFDFSGKMRPGDTIATVESVVATPDSLDVGTATFSGAVAQAPLSDGVDQTEYIVQCLVTTTQGDTLEIAGLLWVANEVGIVWTYNPKLLTPIDLVRFKIGDTVEGAPLFLDAEITATLSANASDVLKTSIELMRSLVRRFARFSGTLKADDVSKDVGKLYQQYREQLEELLLEQRATVGSTRGGQLGSQYLKSLKPKQYC
jgi:hypothetical protein